MALDGDTLTLAMPAPMVKLLTDQSEKIDQTAQTFGGDFRSAFDRGLIGRQRFGLSPADAQRPRPVTHAPGAKPSQVQIDAAMSDDNVRQVQSILGGKVRQVRRQSS